MQSSARIEGLYGRGRAVLSFEVFPPKRDAEPDLLAMCEALGQFAGLLPDFMSVTYGAGGSAAARGMTAEIAARIRALDVPALAHLTCVGQSERSIRDALDALLARGVRNVLALRGDLPDGGAQLGYRYASELIAAIRAHAPDLCIGAACYPEGHIDCDDMGTSLRHLLEKQRAGADFLVAQLCFDNGLFYRFVDAARAAGITLPISAGVMPILSRGQIERMIFLCGASLPARIVKLLHRYENSPADLRRAGIEFAAGQARELAERGADGVHIYTMNHPEIAARCARAVRG